MKTKIVIVLLTGALLALAGWFVHTPQATEAQPIPEKYRDTVQRGLEYLVKHQHKDGHWEGDDGKHPVAMTGLVGLALLMERDAPTGRGVGTVKAKYDASIRKAVHWLLEQSQANRDGLIFSNHPSEASRYMQGHGLATLFLAGASHVELDETRRNKLTDAVTRAVQYIVKAQSSRGGWYHTSKLEGHDLDTIALTAIQIQALQAAESAGIAVPHEAILDAQAYQRAMLIKEDEKAKPGQSRLTDVAATLACLPQSDTGINGRRNTFKRAEFWEKSFKCCKSQIPVDREIKFGHDELVHYYYAQALCSFDDSWSDYRTALFDRLQKGQGKDGSWPTSDGISVGQLYATALWCTVLQLDKRSHPSIPPIRSIIVTWHEDRRSDTKTSPRG